MILLLSLNKSKDKIMKKIPVSEELIRWFQIKSKIDKGNIHHKIFNRSIGWAGHYMILGQRVHYSKREVGEAKVIRKIFKRNHNKIS